MDRGCSLIIKETDESKLSLTIREKKKHVSLSILICTFHRQVN